MFTREGEMSNVYCDSLRGATIFMKLTSPVEKVAFEMVRERDLRGQILSVNLLPMTLVKIPNAVDFLLHEIKINGAGARANCG